MIIANLSPKNINLAVETLKKGGVIVYPTDTAYALGGFFNSVKVIKRVLKIKGRRDDKFTLVASSLRQVEKFFSLNALQKKLARRFWPGPLSIVINSRYAVRVPANSLARRFCRLSGRPLIATSANLTGQPTGYDPKRIIADLKKNKNQPDLIIDAGRLKNKKTSTIVKVERGKVKVLREGSIRGDHVV